MNYTTLNNKPTPRWYLYFWAIVFFILLSFKVFGQERRTKLPILNQKILHYTDSVLGKKVGKGVCWELIHGAFDYAGAEIREYKIKALPLIKVKFRTYGKEIDMDEILPGDIITMWDISHIGIIYEKFDDCHISIAHQSKDHEVIIDSITLDLYYWGFHFDFHRPRTEYNPICPMRYSIRIDDPDFRWPKRRKDR